MNKHTTSKRVNGNGKPPVRDDLHAAEASLNEARCIIETSFLAIDQADDDQDGEGMAVAINTLRVGVRGLRSAEEKLERLGIRLFHEGCPPENVKKLQRESTPPAIHILRSSRSPAQKVKALQKVMGVRPS